MCEGSALDYDDVFGKIFTVINPNNTTLRLNGIVNDGKEVNIIPHYYVYEKIEDDGKVINNFISSGIVDFISVINNGEHCISIPVKDKSLDGHYEFNYMLTDKDKENGEIKIDPYFVAKQWNITNGCLFHVFKTLARFGRKNPVDRETKAMVASLFRYAELENIDLKGMCEDYIERNK